METSVNGIMSRRVKKFLPSGEPEAMIVMATVQMDSDLR